MIRRAHAPDLKSAASESVHVLGILTLLLRVCDCRLPGDFGAVETMAVPVRLDIFFIYQFRNWNFPAERKIVHYNTAPAPTVLLLNEDYMQDENEETKF